MTPPFDSRHTKHIKYVGVRPDSDQDNKCREKLCHMVKDVGCFYELYPEKLYLVYLAKDEDIDDFLDQIDVETSPFIFWSARENPSLHYEPFNMDFGPFNLGVTHQFCSRLKVWLDTQQYRNPDKHIVIVLDDTDTERKLNITLLVAIATMVLFNSTDEEVLKRLNFFMMYNGKPGESKKQLVFREKKKFTDVSGNHSLMTITLGDCVKAFYAALRMKFYDYYEFDHIEYLFYETVISGDLNWIVPGKLLAFAGPSDNPYLARHTPEFYYHYFKDHGVSSIVRLNEPEYRSATFEELGFEHHDLIFPDGYPPTSSIAFEFIKIVDAAKGAVAVHCYAGIGRTGTLIAAYLMARYDFTPQMAVAWTRICRPGSVIGEQQDWLFTRFDQYRDLVSVLSKIDSPKSSKTRKSKIKDTAESSQKNETFNMQLEADNKAPTTYAAAEKTFGQAKALVMAKKQRETSTIDRPRTRIHDKKHAKRLSIERSSFDGDNIYLSTIKETKRTAEDLVLDLGKTVPWSLYGDDVFPLQGKKNPDIYRLRDGKYEWKVKFPQSNYVTLRHSYDLNKPDNAMESDEVAIIPGNSEMKKVILDFMYEPANLSTQPSAKTPIKKKKSKVTSTNNSILGIEASRLRPVVLYTLMMSLC